MIAQKQARAYEEVVEILKGLRDLTEHESRLAEFEKEKQSIREEYPALSGLRGRMIEAGLI